MLASVFLTHLAQGPDFMPVAEGLVIGGVSAPGRRPIPDDAIVDQLILGKPGRNFEAGDRVLFHGRERVWRPVRANKDGWFEDSALENGYLDVSITEPKSTDLILNAQGDSLVYVNGVPRGGDPYSNGYLNLPIRLQKGANELIFVAGRGRISVRTKPVLKPIFLQPEDCTLPDVLTTSKAPVVASVVGLNATAQFTRKMAIRVKFDKKVSLISHVAAIPPYSARKLEFRIPIPIVLAPGTLKIEVELLSAGRVVDSIPLSIQIKGPLDLQKRTFVSQVDGSVQYYAVRPAAKPSGSNALVLTLHGAGVEALGQAAAYASKDWATIVAPTNRRPYGFDWEGIGRLDALEVLDIAKHEFPHDPNRVDLTGHSMGGHGTWSIGTMYPGLFASIAPSAGWISFWSYAGGWNPEKPNPALDLLRRSMNSGDTLGRLDNTLSENVYILHGDADDNVPVEQARTMKAKLEAIHHPDLQYHEQPGAGHWWGNQCVDWPPIFQMIADSKLDLNPNHVDFTTQNPAIASNDRWVTIRQQKHFLEPSRLVADRSAGGKTTVATTNVQAFQLVEQSLVGTVEIDGQQVGLLRSKDQIYESLAGKWKVRKISWDEKSPERSSGFKQVFNHRFLFIVGTAGSKHDADLNLSRAIFFAETMMYRGNGSVDIVLDRDYSRSRFKNRNVILIGNPSTNSAWKDLLSGSPFDNLQSMGGAHFGGLAIYPMRGEKDTLVGAIFGSDARGMRMTDRLALFSSGVDYPDWIVFSPESPEGVFSDGFLSNRWASDPRESATAAMP